MEIELEKQPKKYLDKVDSATRQKLYSSIEEISEFRGNIVKLRGTTSTYRYKIAHYRILFTWNKGDTTITVTDINTRTNTKY